MTAIEVPADAVPPWCADLKKRTYSNAELAYDRTHAFDFPTVRDLVKDVYADQIYSDHAGEDPDQIADDYTMDFKIFPCVKDLK